MEQKYIEELAKDHKLNSLETLYKILRELIQPITTGDQTDIITNDENIQKINTTQLVLYSKSFAVALKSSHNEGTENDRITIDEEPEFCKIVLRCISLLPGHPEESVFDDNNYFKIFIFAHRWEIHLLMFFCATYILDELNTEFQYYRGPSRTEKLMKVYETKCLEEFKKWGPYFNEKFSSSDTLFVLSD